MVRGFLTKARVWWKRLSTLRAAATPAPSRALPTSTRLTRIVVTEGVMRTLFEDYAIHRRSSRGDEETGWILLGFQEGNEATAVAAVPGGADQDASAVHVRFNTEVQALASRILRQQDRRLNVIGVVHTHPGDMRYPSSGDLHGDLRWVSRLRSRSGVFAIGTADHEGPAGESGGLGELCFSWYTLAEGDSNYRPTSVDIIDGGDLGDLLRPVWGPIEVHAESLNRLCRQLARVRILPCGGAADSYLDVRIELAANQFLRLLLSDRDARYYWEGEGKLIAIDPQEPRVDRAVYLVLAELTQGVVCPSASVAGCMEA